MAAPSRYCPTCLSALRPSALLAPRVRPTPSPSLQQSRSAGQQSVGQQSANALKYRKKDQPGSNVAQKKKKTRTAFRQPDMKKALQFSLVDAMRYLRASEAGQSPSSSKYEAHIRLRTAKNGAVIRNRLRLPHPVRTDLRIAVICPADSAYAAAALEAGATRVGEEEIFTSVKEGKLDFDRLLCQSDSLPLLSKAGVARILGPRGLMPSTKLGTVVKDVGAAVRDLAGASEYRERMGVVRMSVGQLAHGPEELRRNLEAFVRGVKRDIALVADQTPKEVHEVVLSSTRGPGLSLSGEFQTGNVGGIGVEEVRGEL